jgi:predicted kinase
MQRGKLFCFCGKMAAGKSTLAREIAQRENAVLLVQDEFLSKLFAEEIVDIPSYVKYSSRLNEALTPHICALLTSGISVVLDFPGNTRTQRAWLRALMESANVEHELHYVDTPDALCKRQLRQRNQGLSAGTAFTSEAEFEAITKYFQAPAADENFKVIHHQRDLA